MFGLAASATIVMARDARTVAFKEREVVRSRALYRSMVQTLPDTAIIVFDRQLRCTSADGPAVLPLFGVTKESIEGRPVLEMARPDHRRDSEALLQAALEGQSQSTEAVREGRTLAISGHALRGTDGQVEAGMLVIRDVTRDRETEAQLAAQATELRALSLRDELTGLYNRRGLLVIAEQQLRAALRSQRHVGAVYVDLDGMKAINDQQGHEAGDRALVESAAALRETFRGEDVIARIGGDEFVVFVGEATLEASR
jgi:PAS domain S-box-containing protein